MDDKKRTGRYQRIYAQLKDLTEKTEDPVARMASVCAVLHHKMDCFFWTGFYLLKGEQLIVGPYQGPVACQELEKNRGVCWTTVNTSSPVVVPDVNAFTGHITCDSRSKSEITIPVFGKNETIKAILDVDSDQLNAFNEVDKEHLEKIVDLIYR